MGRVKEKPRRCGKCALSWWAVEAEKPRKVQNAWLAMGAGLDAASFVTRAAANQSMQLREWERWGICSRCGSQDIQTVKDKGFVPTGLAEAAGPGIADAPPPAAGGPTPQGPGPSGSEPQPSRDASGVWQVGARVTVRQFGYRGLQGTVAKRGAMGNYTVNLDRGDKATSIPGDKLERA